MKIVRMSILLLIATAAVAQGAAADEGWRYGIGTGISSFKLDGDIGFPSDDGGVIIDGKLDNSDTRDLIDSAFGLEAFAQKDRWRFGVRAVTMTLEDGTKGYKAEWDRTEGALWLDYNFATTGYHRWGALLGARYNKHEWTFKTPTERSKPDDDWTDVMVGLTHSVPFSEKWFWTNRVDYGFGGSEGTWHAATAINWMPFDHWIFNVSADYLSTEFGEKKDINKSDFYYYDVDQTTFGIGVVFTW